MSHASALLARACGLPRAQTEDVVREKNLRVTMDDGVVLVADPQLGARRGDRVPPVRISGAPGPSFRMEGTHEPRGAAMLFIHVEALNERNADLRRSADRDRSHRAPRVAHRGPSPQPPRRRAIRSFRDSAATVAGRVMR